MENVIGIDLIEIVFLFTAFIQMSICLLATVLQQMKFFALIGSIEPLIDKSELFVIFLSSQFCTKESLKWKK